MTITYRSALPNGIDECLVIRGSTPNNAISVERLNELSVTLVSWSQSVGDGSLPGYVCLDQKKIIGYCFGDQTTGEIVVTNHSFERNIPRKHFE